MDEVTNASSSSAHRSRRPRKGRRETVRAACNFCCTRKIKCDAIRPQCSACVSRGRVCIYDTKDDFETRGAATKRKVEHLERQLLALSLTRCENCRLHAAREVEDTGQPSSAASIMDDISSIPDSPIATSTPTLYDVSVMPHASQILSALLNSTDEGSTGMLAALRVGLPWKEVDRVNHSTILLQESPQPWLDTAPPALSHEQHEHANVGLSDMTYSMLFSFDRRIWMRELVRYNKSSHATPNAEYIQVVSDPMADSDATTFEAPSAAVNGPSNSGLRWTYQVPLCAVASMVDIGDLRCPFVKMYLDMSAAINMGMNVQTLFGSHAHISALSSEETYMKAPRLSQGIASMVNSMKLEGDEGHVPRTRCALMWLYWLLWRWLLDTSAASFQALPRMLRPTPWQMTVAHPLVFDFVTSPGLRDHLCQQGVLECKWLTAACASLSCDDTPEDFYYIDPFTGELDISLAGKAHICRPDSWSFGPDMRQFFYNIDMYMRVRPPATAG